MAGREIRGGPSASQKLPQSDRMVLLCPPRPTPHGRWGDNPIPSPVRLVLAMLALAGAIGFSAAAIQTILAPVGRLTIDEAMRTVEQRIGGTAAYDIEVIMPDGSVRSMLIDPRTGLIVSDMEETPNAVQRFRSRTECGQEPRSVAANICRRTSEWLAPALADAGVSHQSDCCRWPKTHHRRVADFPLPSCSGAARPILPPARFASSTAKGVFAPIFEDLRQ